MGFPHTLSGAAIWISLFIYLYTRAKCSHVVSIRNREDPGNEKAVCLSQKNYHHFAIIILIYTCEMFVASLGEETLQRSLATNISQVFGNCLLLLNLIRERTVGNPSATKGQTDNIKNLRTGLWSTLGVMLNEFAYEFRFKVCERSRQQRNAA